MFSNMRTLHFLLWLGSTFSFAHLKLLSNKKEEKNDELIKIISRMKSFCFNFFRDFHSKRDESKENKWRRNSLLRLKNILFCSGFQSFFLPLSCQSSRFPDFFVVCVLRRGKCLIRAVYVQAHVRRHSANTLYHNAQAHLHSAFFHQLVWFVVVSEIIVECRCRFWHLCCCIFPFSNLWK